MMDLDRNLAEALATWGQLRRGWDRPGSLASLARVKGRNADDVAMAWARFCADPDARTPGAFPNLAGPHWQERVAPPQTPRPPKPHEACRTCGRAFAACDCDGGPTVRPVVTADSTRGVARLRAAHETAAADLCSHGTPRRNCLEHRHPTEGDPNA